MQARGAMHHSSGVGGTEDQIPPPALWRRVAVTEGEDTADLVVCGDAPSTTGLTAGGPPPPLREGGFSVYPSLARSMSAPTAESFSSSRS